MSGSSTGDVNESKPLPGAGATNVFLSYSRADTAFVELLAEALERAGMRPQLDTTHIRKGEDWWQRIVNLIVDSSVILFIMSPDSIDSPVCAQELELSARLNKRLIPILFRPLQGRTPPPALQSPNWINIEALGRHCQHITDAWKAKEAERGKSQADFATAEMAYDNAVRHFLESREFASVFPGAIEEIGSAIRLPEFQWFDEQVEWLRRALAWEQAQRPTEGALSIADLDNCQQWANRRPADEPIHSSIWALIEASRDKHVADRDDRNRIIGRAFVKPAREALEREHFDDALRITAAGIILSEDTENLLVPERERQSLARHAAWRSRTRMVLHNSGSRVNSVRFCQRRSKIRPRGGVKVGHLWCAHETAGRA